MVNGIGPYIFTVSVKYEGSMETSSNTPPRHITNCGVQIAGAFVQLRYGKVEISTVCKCFLHTEIPLTQWKCQMCCVL